MEMNDKSLKRNLAGHYGGLEELLLKKLDQGVRIKVITGRHSCSISIWLFRY